MNRTHHREAGFTLIEVALAVLALGLGVLVVFSLVPSSLRLAEEDKADTRCSEFAEVVMQGMRGNASTIQDWTNWNNQASFSAAVLGGANVVPGAAAVTGAVTAVTFPVGGEPVRYKLVLDASSHSAMIEVCDGQYGPFDPAIITYTEFIYQGD